MTEPASKPATTPVSPAAHGILRLAPWAERSGTKVGDRTLVAVTAGVAILSMGFLAAQVWEIVGSGRKATLEAAQTQQIHLTIDRLHQERFVLIDEIAHGGGADVAQRFREADVRQADALLSLAERAATPAEEAAASGLTFAYHTLAAIESDALALALAGREARALETLYSQEHSAARVAFGEAMSDAREAMWPRIAITGQRIDRAMTAAMIVGPVAASTMIGLLFAILRRFTALSRRTASLERALSGAQTEAARREREAHANMIARCPAPTAEFEFAPAMKLAAWLKQRGVDDLERWLKIYPGEIRKLAPQFRVLRANKAAADLLGAREPAELRELDRWIPDRSLHACVLAILRAFWNKSTLVTATIEVRGFDGAERLLELKGSLTPRGKGKPPALIACLTDVTQAVALRRELAGVREDTTQRAKKSEEFLTTVSRDLRAALDGVTGMAAVLDRTRLDREQREALAVIRDSGELMRDALDRARDYRRLDAGGLEISSAPFDVGAVVQAVNTRFAPRAKAKSLRLRMAIDEAARRKVTGDEARVRQILTKLISNAIEYTPHGEVEARIGLEPEPDGASQLVLTVRDTGAGLAPAELAGALDDAQDNGSGLAFCRRLCIALGGRLEITSSPDYGTTVVARIRVAEARQTAAAPAAKAEEPAPRGRRLSLLAADDNAINRIVLKDMIEPWGADLTLVENGADAIAAWRAQTFDVILLDIQMPLLSGYDVAREIRKLEAETGRARTPIIAVSASVMKSEVDACLAAGMDAHVPKPIELAKLKAAVTAAAAPRESDGAAASAA